MDKYKVIRPIVLGIIERDGKILVDNGYDSVKDQHFYRCLGGGIEFLEKSDEALKREFKEELNVDIEVGKFLGISENIFNYEGKDAHELVLFYSAKLKDEDYKESYVKLDDDKQRITWEDKKDFIEKKKIIYPEIVIDYL
jgi:ADP-ribose pyrophosphatase YjhB (NUDIX family)